IVHAPPAVADRLSIGADHHLSMWEAHSMIGSMEGSPDKLGNAPMCGAASAADDSAAAAAIGLGPASWASGGGPSVLLDHTSAASSWDIARPAAKRNRRTKHPVWELFRRTSSGQAQCQLCSAFVRSPCSSNFMGHLNRHHTDHYKDVYNRWLTGRRSNSVSEPHVSSTTNALCAPSFSPPPRRAAASASCAPTGALTAPSLGAYAEPFAFDYASAGAMSYGAGATYAPLPQSQSAPSLNCGLESHVIASSPSNVP
ncbi:hypothetical protein PFISCL1PPCAC_13632, partial [Pristionchus fissidentatus]